MTMRPTNFKALLAGLGLCGAGLFAWALDPTATPINCGTHTACIYISGSPGVDNLLANTVARGVAAGGAGNGTCDRWLDGKLGSTAQTTELIYCSLSAGKFFGGNLGAAKTELAVWKYSVGESTNGIGPIYNSLPLNFQLTYQSCAPAVGMCGGGGTPDMAYTSHTCSAQGGTAAQVPYIGFSDQEPRVFGFATTPTAGFRSDPSYQLVFGIAATKYLRDQLQRAKLCNPGGEGNLPVGCAVGDETVTCQPSISHGMVSGIMQGKVTLWTQLFDACGAPFSLVGSGGGSQTVFFARRSNGSGTQRISNINFMAQGECTNVLNFAPAPLPGTASATPSVCLAAPPNPTILPTGANRIFQMNSNEDLLECMNDFNTNVYGALAIASTDYQPGGQGGALPSGYRFLKLDGVAPSLAQAAKGRYIYVSEPTMQSQDITSNPYTDPAVAPFRDALLAALQSVANAQESNVCNNTGSASPWWGGALIPQTVGTGGSVGPAAPNPITEAAIHTTPVATATKQGNTTGRPANCYPTTGFPAGLYDN
jgi:hypothetical protein